MDALDDKVARMCGTVNGALQARLGGEEFVALLPGCPVGEGVMMAENCVPPWPRMMFRSAAR